MDKVQTDYIKLLALFALASLSVRIVLDLFKNLLLV